MLKIGFHYSYTSYIFLHIPYAKVMRFSIIILLTQVKSLQAARYMEIES